ncbi:MAG: hypothetical protein KFW21_03575 [Spirochaetota bacterium]|nr:hypothetical protein [Spirochaetota bacterium]
MKNIIWKLFNILIVFIGFTYCSPNLDEKSFLRDISGTYTLSKTGVSFITRELTGYVTESVTEGTELEMRGDGSLSIIFSPTSSQKIAQFIKLKLEKQGLYELENKKTYVAMGKKELLLIATTNSEISENNVRFEHLVPIAIEKPQ